MRHSIGRLTVRLAAPAVTVNEGLMNLLNNNIKPAHPLRPEDVYIRAMYIVSDEVNSYGGRFPREEHLPLIRLLVDTPVMVGHRRDKLPIGRTFHADRVVRDGVNWVKSYFYWLRTTDHASDLAEKIDRGIIKECSIAFTYRLPECSICGKDIRLCRHEPLQEFPTGNGVQKCHYNYRQLERVLETSLVYRGAIPDTSITNELVQSDTRLHLPTDGKTDSVRAISSLDELMVTDRYLVVPRYEGLPVTITLCDGLPTVIRSNGRQLDMSNISLAGAGLERLSARLPLRGQLVGYRGKERLPVSRLEDFIAGRKSSVLRVVLFVYPDGSSTSEDTLSGFTDKQLRFFPFRYASRDRLARAAREIMTREGVEIWALDHHGRPLASVLWRPDSVDHPAPAMTLRLDPGSSQSYLSFRHEGRIRTFRIVSFGVDAFRSGRRFVAREVSESAPRTARMTTLIEETAPAVTSLSSGAFSLAIESEPALRLHLQPIRLNGKRRFLMCRVAG